MIPHEVFNIDIDEQISTLSVDQNNVYTGTISRVHPATALGINRYNGDLQFSIQFEKTLFQPEVYAINSIAVDDKGIYIGVKDTVYAFDKSQKLLWGSYLRDVVRKYTGNDFMYRLDFIKILGNDLVVLSTDGDYFRLDKQTGSVYAYEKFAQGETFCKMYDETKNTIVINNEQRWSPVIPQLLFLDPKTGNVFRKHSLEHPIFDLDVDGQNYYLMERRGNILVVDKSSLETIRTRNFSTSDALLNLIVDEENIYFTVGWDSRKLFCIDKSTFENKWKIRWRGFKYPYNVATKDGIVYVGGHIGSRGDVMGYSLKKVPRVDTDFSFGDIYHDLLIPHKDSLYWSKLVNERLRKIEKEGGITISKLPRGTEMILHTDRGKFRFKCTRPKKGEFRMLSKRGSSKVYIRGSNWGTTMTVLDFIGLNMYPDVTRAGKGYVLIPVVRGMEIKGGPTVRSTKIKNGEEILKIGQLLKQTIS
jgi:hypothetical protein